MGFQGWVLIGIFWKAGLPYLVLFYYLFSFKGKGWAIGAGTFLIWHFLLNLVGDLIILGFLSFRTITS